MIHVVVAIDGHQHGSSPFHTKCVAIEEARSGVGADVVLNLPQDALHQYATEASAALTYSHQQSIHGLWPEQRGLPLSVLPTVIDDIITKASEPYRKEGLMYVPAVCYGKGEGTLPIIREFLNLSSIKGSQVVDLHQMGCPSLKKLGLKGRPIKTTAKASALAEWLQTSCLSRQLL